MKKYFLLWLLCLPFLFLSCDELSDAQVNQLLTLGCNLQQELFDQAEVYEPLATVLPDNKLPPQVSLERFAPRRLSQGQQGSCTAWATAYAAATILRAGATGENPDEVAYSPSFVYNQLTRGNCTGTHIGKTLERLKGEGVLSLSEFPYTDERCDNQPGTDKKQRARQNRIPGFNRLTLNHDNYKVDINAVKQNIAQGAPVVVGMMVGGSFYNMTGRSDWQPTRRDFEALKKGATGRIVDDGTDSGFGGHAMCIIGYDDTRNGGSFQIMNSWGEDWGDRGLFWMNYKDFEYFCNSFYGEAYGLYPLPRKAASDFALSIGLFENNSRQYIPFKQLRANVFSTTGIVPKGTRFKIAVDNQTACYTYVTGQETDGSSYVLFPYTEKHSPYCGITGARLFPKDYSLELDDIGSKDVMAVIVSKEPLDYIRLNEQISQSQKPTYQEKIAEALGQLQVNNVSFSDGEKITFTANTAGAGAVAIIFEIKKR